MPNGVPGGPPPVRDTRACYLVIVCGMALQMLLAWILSPQREVYASLEVERSTLTALYFGLAGVLNSLWGIATVTLVLLAGAFLTFEQRGGRAVTRCYCGMALLVLLSLSLPAACYLDAGGLERGQQRSDQQESREPQSAG